jgi:hypothetical protein
MRKLNENARHYVISDIHDRLDMLDRLVDGAIDWAVLTKNS